MNKQADLVVYHIGELITPRPHAKPVKGKHMDEVITLHDAFIAVKDGLIIAVDTGDYQPYVFKHTKLVDAEGKLVTPGLIDSHTHVVHYGSREYEFEKKLRGVSYLDILKEGGGILSSVKMTQEASKQQLYRQSKHSLDIMLKHGVTTVEGKSGYGLFEDHELKQLRVQKKLNASHPIDLIATFLGAHAMPPSYKENRQAFIDHVIKTMDVVKKESLADFVDVFCETGVFDLSESRQILEAAKRLGFKLKIHADEIKALGGVQMACELGAKSADHLMVITDEGIKALSESQTVAGVLPATSFNLNSDYAPVRKMIDAGVAVAVCSDYNPGSSPSENFLFTLNIAAIHLKMSPAEVLNAATINAAHSIDKAQHIGVLSPGYQADFVIYDAQNWPYVLYHFAINHVKDVYKRGKLVVKDQNICRGDKDEIS